MTTTTTPHADVTVVRSGFEAFANGDIAAFAAMFHTDATWHHRNDDRLGGVHRGSDGIVAFLTESMRLTAGTLRPVPQSFLTDGAGQVAVLTRISASRPDGRTFDDAQVLVFTVEAARVRSVEQYVGDPEAVTAFWA